MEPTYEYHPGQGWIATLKPPLITKDGVRVCLEKRKPTGSERGTWHTLGDWDMARWEQWAAQAYYSHMDEGRYMGTTRNVDWVTVIPLDGE